MTGLIDKIVRSKRRTIALVITKDATLEVRAPFSTSLGRIEKFVAEKRLWIEKKKDFVSKNRKNILPGNSQKLSPQATIWYKNQSLKKITDRINYYANITQLKYKTIKLTSAKRSWGSCSHKGSLRINWRLVMAPLDILDYVVVHELIHLVEKNHSKQFWHKVQTVLPNYKEQRNWLKLNGDTLINEFYS
ncbi:MAG: SprT family zinc-dependent metalloprotease [bacterium]